VSLETVAGQALVALDRARVDENPSHFRVFDASAARKRAKRSGIRVGAADASGGCMASLRLSAILVCVTAAACGSSAGSASSTGPQPSAPMGDWSCVSLATPGAQAKRPGSVETLVSVPPPGSTGGSTSFSVFLAEAYTDEGLPGVWVTACNAIDATCAWPITRVQADEYGLATLTLPEPASAFGGYLKVTAPGMPDNYVSLAGHRATYGSDATTLTVYTTAALSLTYSLAGLPYDAQHALVHVDVGDCSGVAASGVAITFEADQLSGITTGYSVGDGSAMSRTATSTDGSGAAFAFGVVPGPVAVLGRLEGTIVGDAMGFAYAGAVTSMNLHASAAAAALK
jgi:hypothetical protein